MKVTQAIQQLAEVMRRHGDIEVCSLYEGIPGDFYFGHDFFFTAVQPADPGSKKEWICIFTDKQTLDAVPEPEQTQAELRVIK